ncbi:hypothetical protein ACJX0J_011210, partial [Zea mays]
TLILLIFLFDVTIDADKYGPVKMPYGMFGWGRLVLHVFILTITQTIKISVNPIVE